MVPTLVRYLPANMKQFKLAQATGIVCVCLLMSIGSQQEILFIYGLSFFLNGVT